LINLNVYLIFGLDEAREETSTLQHFKNEISSLFPFIVDRLDQDPDFQSGSGSRYPIESGSDLDTDPKH
jgi:hypothetical protein